MTLIEKEELLCSKYDKINRFLAINGVPAADREDLLQEVFIKALRALKKLQDINKMEGWLLAIAANVVHAHYNKTNKETSRVVVLEQAALEELTTPGTGDGSQIVDEIDSLAEQETITEVFRHLDESTKMLFQLHYFLGYSFRDIATMRRMNYSTIKSMHQRGLKKLRNLLREGRDGKDDE